MKAVQSTMTEYYNIEANLQDLDWQKDNDNETVYHAHDVAYEMFLVVRRMNDYVSVGKKSKAKVQEFDDDEDEDKALDNTGDKLAADRDDDDDVVPSTQDATEKKGEIDTPEINVAKKLVSEHPERVCQSAHNNLFDIAFDFARFINCWMTTRYQLRFFEMETCSECILRISKCTHTQLYYPHTDYPLDRYDHYVTDEIKHELELNVNRENPTDKIRDFVRRSK